jgi:DNA repair protein RecO (recombination protein O)
MPIEKSQSVVLSVMPFRESSIIASLFTRHHGRINAIAKGIRKTDRRRVPIERGYLIDHIVYLKHHGDLHQITDCNINEYFPLLRGNLEKTATRDLLFDVVLSAIPVRDPHPELFDHLTGFLEALSSVQPGLGGHLMYLSKTLFGFAAHLGFSLDFTRCVHCGNRPGERSIAWLAIDQGAVRCDSCSSLSNNSGERLLQSAAAVWLAEPDNGRTISTPFTDQEALGVLRLAYDYCRYHLDIRKNLDSFAFVEHLAGR